MQQHSTYANSINYANVTMADWLNYTTNESVSMHGWSNATSRTTLMRSNYEILHWKGASVLFQTVGIIMAVICLPLYVFVIFVVVKKMLKERQSRVARPKFYNPNYQILLSMAAADFMDGFSWVIMIYPYFTPPVPTWYDNYAYALRYFDLTFWHSIGLHILIGSFYRFWVIVFPTNRRVFTMTKTTIMLVILWAIAFGINLPSIINADLNPWASWRPSDCFMGWGGDRIAGIILYAPIGYLEVAILIAVPVLYAAVMIKLCQSRRRVSGGQGGGISRYEINLTVQQMVVYVCFAANTLFWKYSQQVTDAGVEACIVGYIVVWLSMWQLCGEPVIYLVVNKELRKASLELLGKKVTDSGGSSLMSNTRTRRTDIKLKSVIDDAKK